VGLAAIGSMQTYLTMWQSIASQKMVAKSRTGIVMVLHLVKGPMEETLELDDDDNECLHGCKMMLHLLCTWSTTRWQIICADSYFGSTSELYSKWFHFIGVVKTATCLFLKDYLSTIKMPNHGAVLVLIRSPDDCELLGFVYCDHNRHYFVSTCADIAGGNPIQHVWLQQLQPVDCLCMKSLSINS
jgi:hypothetical protein